MPEGGPHAEVGPKSKLSPRVCVTKEEELKSLQVPAQAMDKTSMIDLVYPMTAEYLNGRLFPQLRPV